MITLSHGMTTQDPQNTFEPRLSDLDDNELIEQCRCEVPQRLDAFREFVTRYEPEVFETCFRLLADKPAAEQACEDAFLQVFHQVHRYFPGTSHSSVRVWLFQIVYRLCELRVESKTSRLGLFGGASDDSMGRALSILDWDERSWIALRFVGCLQTREIAEILELDIPEAKQCIYQALSRFREASELIAS